MAKVKAKVKFLADDSRRREVAELARRGLVGNLRLGRRFAHGGAVADFDHDELLVDGRRYVAKSYGTGKLVPRAYSRRDAEVLCKATVEYSELLAGTGINVPVLHAVQPAEFRDAGSGVFAVELIQELVADGVNVQDLIARRDFPPDKVAALHQAILECTKQVIDSPSEYKPKPPFEVSIPFDNRVDNFTLDAKKGLFFVDFYPPFQLDAGGRFAADEQFRRNITGEDLDWDKVHTVISNKLFLYCRPVLFMQMARPRLLKRLERQTIKFVEANEEDPAVAKAVREEIAAGYPKYEVISPEVARGLIKVG